jgi:hypothetical protein
MNAEIPQRLHNRRAVATADESNEHDVAAQLPKYACHIRSLATGLYQNRSAAVNLVWVKVFDLKYSIKSEGGTNHDEACTGADM